MRSPVMLVFIIVLAILPSTSTSAVAVSVKNAGFETRAANSLPDGWDLQAGAVAVALDNVRPHAGVSSLKISHEKPGSSLLFSAPVRLEVGKLYRLKAWIRTEDVQADASARYATPVAATIMMESFPFTNSAPSVGGTRDWTSTEVLFFATRSVDRIGIQLGHNGSATGTAWFDDLSIEEVANISEYIPPETVRWFGPAFRYTDNGWIYVHIEGKPYQRGYQYGSLMAKEMVAYMEKLALRQNPDNARDGWAQTRTLADALMLRQYDEEYLEEMKGIADGAAKAGAVLSGKALDLLDVVAMNSVVDIGQLSDALANTATAITGRSFRAEENEMNAPERLHKCSSFLANGPATSDGRIVFGQLFMWSGYTGVHWNVICDVVPEKGHRLVYQTFPGGIHSGSDFYINDAGIMIGETTVAQTPFNAAGTPQSSRIRKAAQYAGSVDDVVKILTERNNGLYTNDWLIGDTKRNETAILLLGTEKFKLWRSGKNDFPGGTTGFYWSVNNAKDPGVRSEYIPDPANAPFDVVFSSVNRDIAFVDFYRREKGKIDAIAAVNTLGSSPLNRPHACDGKVTTSEMAEQLMFMAHHGKVTLREKFPEKGSRLMPDLAGVQPHLTLGYTTFSPIVVAEQLKAARRAQETATPRKSENVPPTEGVYAFEKNLLWANTVLPASDADNWFVSGTAAYWNILNNEPVELRSRAPYFRDQLAEANCRLQYTISREGPLAPIAASRHYDGYKHYVVPRVRGTFALHQLRMLLGNAAFADVMTRAHTQFKNRAMTTAQFTRLAEEVSGRPLAAFIAQWTERDDLPSVTTAARAARDSSGWRLEISATQRGRPYHFFTTVAVETAKETVWRVVEIDSPAASVNLAIPGEPLRMMFNAGNDIPVERDQFYTFSNFFDDFAHTSIVYGTGRQVEANHTLALRYQTVLADAFTEALPPVKQDASMDREAAGKTDLILLGGPADNTLVRDLCDTLHLTAGKNSFAWKGRQFADDDDGLVVVLPNPYNPSRVVYVLMANSALQLYQMTKRFQGMPSWALFKGDQIVERGFHTPAGFEIDLKRTLTSSK